MLDPTSYTLAQSKTGYWEIRWSEPKGGRHVSRSHSTRTRSRSEAELYRKHWLKARAEILAQTSPGLTVGELIDRYELNAKARKVGPTQYIVLDRLRQAFGAVLPGEIDEEDLMDYRADRGVSDGTLRRELGVLVAVFNFGVRKKLVGAGDIPHIDLPPEGQRREVFLSVAEEAALTKILLGEPMSRVSRFMLLALRTGARRGAIKGLTWDRVDLERRFVDYREPGAKASKKRRVPVPIDDVLFPVLEQAKMFATDEFVIGAGRIRSHIENFRAAHPEFAHVTPHVLRHTAATRWLRDGLSLWDVAGLLGDTVETTTKVYGHHATSDLRAAMSRSAA